ncbi:Shikimate kinase [anaerobic digester metagenome]
MYRRTGEARGDLRDFPRLCGVLDLIYNPQRTRLLLQAEALGIPWSDGLPMLVAQAVAAEELFFGRSIPESETERILNQLRFDSTNLVLIGMPGCGKSTVGQALGQLTGREVIETDRRIVERAGRTIPELFADRGEAYFRELEREEVERAGRESGKIIVTGGGVVKDRRNYDALRQNGRIYQLERSLSLLAREGRPLSQAGELEELWRERQPLYESFRDAAVDNSGTPEDTAAMIWRDFNEYFGH